MFFVGISIILQIFWFTEFVYLLGSRYQIFMNLIQIVCAVAILWIVNKRINPAYKLAWTILILLVPVVGASLYLMFGNSRMAKTVKHSYDEAAKSSEHVLIENPKVREKLEQIDLQINKQSVYLRDYAGFPVYQNTQTEYFPVGELLYQRMIEELKKAEHFIFLEYFIIDNGEMWQSILNILEEKAKNGVDVRLIYDDVGCVNTLPSGFYKEVRARGIQCEVFNPFRPVVSVVLNNRDHRKIMVIDGHTGFSGGINLADEYINRIVKHGHWKDNCIRIKGEAVWSYTVLFLTNWNALRPTDEDFSIFHAQAEQGEADGYIAAYGDSPFDNESTGQNVYMNILNNAKKYVYISTPYLIIDTELENALILAAKRGVDVRILTPGVADKKTVWYITRSFYQNLIAGGVKIYEYTPGFNHAKVFVSDDEAATVGTINLDYRSLYLHFENGTYLCGSKKVMNIRDDMIACYQVSHQMHKGDIKENIFQRMAIGFIKLFAAQM